MTAYFHLYGHALKFEQSLEKTCLRVRQNKITKLHILETRQCLATETKLSRICILRAYTF